MDAAIGKITYHDGIWSNILCSKCDIAHKQITVHMHWQTTCPYCNSVLEVPSLRASLKENSLLDTITNIGVQVAQEMMSTPAEGKDRGE
ncbi:MAG: hypothetical protein AMJ56_07650 [Anaerolineae bacterium SG8_19]|nr:MAG: hypothetical protein AMJ56_07650 [Anaerolineae bacterium SG8_19]